MMITCVQECGCQILGVLDDDNVCAGVWMSDLGSIR